MKKFLVGAALALSVLAVTTSAFAVDLPTTMLGSWTQNGGSNDFEVTGVNIAPTTYNEPGYNCQIVKVTAKPHIGLYIYIVNMSCRDNGTNESPEKIREVWALRTLNGIETLVQSNAAINSVRLLQRPTEAPQAQVGEETTAPEYKACHDDDNIAACDHWRDRECHNGNRAACDYYVSRKQKYPTEWCAAQGYSGPEYRFCLNGSPDV